ncbi:hypothetical protein L1049_010755 [Liquidambar formosana]|uniref:Beta-glucosidase n=1 Tax=Liquidambar formosana TaxID=63359 RepID=A0AAP0N4K8_LIQFO
MQEIVEKRLPKFSEEKTHRLPADGLECWIFLPALLDTTRINFYKGYLSQMKKAINDGANVVGYPMWLLLDNFEWLSG